MKKLITLSIAVLACLITIAQRPKGTAQKGMTFGAKTNVAGAVLMICQKKLRISRKRM